LSGKEIGQALLLVGFLLSVAGIVEPSWGTSSAVAVFVLVGFMVWVTRSHDEWRKGYEQGRVDAGKKLLDYNRMIESEREARVASLTSSPLWKCGMEGCYCANDSRYKEYEDD